jgi:predicted TIM-barrel fold metal-dependent hydrolase
MSTQPESRELFHTPDVTERLTSDDGFSRTWGEHFQPCEDYWIDCHVHMEDQTADVVARAVREFFQRLDAWRLRRIIALSGRSENLKAFAAVAHCDDRFTWMIYPRYNEPDLASLLPRAFEAGALGLKLHNVHVLTDGADHKVWLGRNWQGAFDRVAGLRKPILWHVTQRLTDSPYTGGARNSYWAQAWEKGVKYRNADLLETFLQVVGRWPDIPFIGAHQLHVGFEKLEELFNQYPNLYVDTSIGCFVRWGDQMYEPDRLRAHQFFTRHASRILFGTDCGVGVEATEEYVFQAFLGHARYLHQLNLAHEVLQDVSHRNAERLFALPAVQVSRKGNLRP